MKHITLPFSRHHALEIIHNLDTLSAIMKSTYHQELKHHLYSECEGQCHSPSTEDKTDNSFDDPLDF